MTTTFDSLYTEYAIASFDKQLHLAVLHGEDAWGYDLDSGQITFNNTVSYKTQIIGTEDHVDKTWMWGWANKASNIPDELLSVAHDLRSHGEQHAIRELTEAMQPLGSIDGHAVSLIASAFGNAKAYYRCPYDSGALFVLITDDNLQFPSENKIMRAARVILEGIAALEIHDHRAAVGAYFRLQGFEFASDGSALVVKSGGLPLLTAEFDELNRLTKLESRLQPGSET